MQDQRNLTQDDVLDIMGKDGNSFKYEPMFNYVIVTLNKEGSDGGLIVSDNTLSEEQYVIAVGETSRINAGQKVLMNIEKMMVPVKPEDGNSHEAVSKIKIEPIYADFEGKEFMFALIEDRYIKSKIRS